MRSYGDTENMRTTKSTKRPGLGFKQGTARSVLTNITNQSRASRFASKIKKPAVSKQSAALREVQKPRVRTRSFTNKMQLQKRIKHMQQANIDPMEIDETIINQRWDDIDLYDHKDPQAETTNVNEIFEELRDLEKRSGINPRYMQEQSDINERMRAILVDWMVAVHTKFLMLPETLYLAVNVLDRFLAAHQTGRGQLQLVAIGAFFIAAKYEEIYPPESADFIHITDNSYSKEQLFEMEALILNTLKWNLTVPTALHFLRRFSKAARSDLKAHTLTKYLCEIPLLDVKMLKYPPSLIAASCVFIARAMLNENPVWTPTLEHYTTYRECDTRACALEINALLRRLQKSSLSTIRKKYSRRNFEEVAKIPIVHLA